MINGAGAGTTIVQASPTGSATAIDRVFDIGAISGVTIRYGNAPSANGGGIAVRSGSSLTLNNCVISENTSGGYFGAGIYNAGTLTVMNSTVANNQTIAGAAASTHPAQ